MTFRRNVRDVWQCPVRVLEKKRHLLAAHEMLVPMISKTQDVTLTLQSNVSQGDDPSPPNIFDVRGQTKVCLPNKIFPERKSSLAKQTPTVFYFSGSQSRCDMLGVKKSPITLKICCRFASGLVW